MTATVYERRDDWTRENFAEYEQILEAWRAVATERLAVTRFDHGDSEELVAVDQDGTVRTVARWHVPDPSAALPDPAAMLAVVAERAVDARRERVARAEREWPAEAARRGITVHRTFPT